MMTRTYLSTAVRWLLGVGFALHANPSLAGDDLARARIVMGGARNYLTVLDWIIIVVYGVSMLAVGWYYWRQTQSSEDYLLGGRKMRPLAVGLSLFATLFSTISYLAAPGEMIKNGPMILSMIVAYPFVSLVAGRLMIPYIMTLRITSAYELLETRLGLSIRLLGSTAFLLMRLLWMAVIIYATVDKLLVPLLGLDPAYTLWVSAVLGLVTLVYTAMGGLKAVVITDAAQGIVLFAGAIVAIIAVTISLGGVGAWWPTGWAAHWTKPTFYDPNIRVSFLSAVLANFTWYVCTAGSDQMAIQRYLATRDARAARRVLNTSLLASTAVLLLLAVLGLSLMAFFSARPDLLAPGQDLVKNADEMFTRFIVVGLPPGFSGLVVAGLLAAAMSSLSAGINSCCSVITADVIDRFRLRRREGRSAAGHAMLERGISVLVGIVVLVLSIFVNDVQGNLFDKMFKIVNLLSAPLFGLFFMAMFVPWARALGAWIGFFAGLVVVVALNFWNELAQASFLLALWPGLAEIQPISFFWAMPLSILTQIVVGTLASLLPVGRRAGRWQ